MMRKKRKWLNKSEGEEKDNMHGREDKNTRSGKRRK